MGLQPSVHGACSSFSLFTLVWLFLSPLCLCNDPEDSDYFEFATFTITQYALDDAPSRYATFVNDAIDFLNNQSWTDYTDDGGDCDSTTAVYGSQVYNKEITLDNDSLSVTIENYGFYIHAEFELVAYVPVYYEECDGWWIFCFCDTVCDDDTVIVSGPIVTDSRVEVVWDGSSLTLTPNVTIDTSGMDYDYSACDTDSIFVTIVSWFYDISAIITDSVQDAVNEYLESIETQVNVPQEFSPYSGVDISYQVTDLEFAAKDYVKIAAQAVLAVQNDTGGWVYYQDSNPSDAAVAPSNSWPHSPYLSDYYDIDTVNETLYLLNGLRVSTTVFSAMMWAAQTMGELNPSYSFTVLDATLIFNLTWQEPVFLIPSNDTLIIQLEYTNINGTCYETQSNDGYSNVIQFSMYNLTANASVGIVVNNTGGSESVLVTVNNFDLDGVDPTLEYPPIPLPSSVIESLLKELINATIPYLNDWLATHKFEIPSDIAQYLPNPVLSLIHQDAYNVSDHGVVEVLSWCSCSNKSTLFSACSGFECVEATRSPVSPPTTSVSAAPTSPPTPLPTEPPTGAPSDAPTNSPTEAPPTANTTQSVNEQIISSLDGLWMNLYVSNFFNSSSSTSDNSLCDISHPGDYARILLLDDTQGVCKQLPMSITASEFNYYFVSSDSSGITEIGILCKKSSLNDSCVSCDYSGDSIVLGQCDAIDSQYHVMFLGYERENSSTSSSSDSSGTSSPVSSTDYEYSSPCVGGNHVPDINDVNGVNVVWVTYNGTQTCDSSYLIIQNLGAFNQCSLYDSDSTRSYYSLVEFGDDYTAGLFSFDSDYQLRSYNLTLMCTNSTCEQNQCSQSYKGLKYDTCKALEETTFSTKFVWASDLDNCGETWQNETKSKSSPTPSSIIDEIESLAAWQIVLIVLGCLVLVMLCVAGLIWRSAIRWNLKLWYEKGVCVKEKEFVIKYLQWSFWWFYDFFGLICFNPLPPMEIYQTLAMFGASLFLIWQDSVWTHNNPWSVFSTESFDELGIDSSYLDVENLNAMFDEWSEIAKIITRLFIYIFLFLAVARFGLVKPKSYAVWSWMRIIALMCYLVCQFGMFIGPSLFYDFKESISLNTDNIENGSLLSSASAQDSINELIGYSFGGIFVSYLANILLYWMHCIPGAGYIIVMFYFYKQLSISDYTVYNDAILKGEDVVDRVNSPYNPNENATAGGPDESNFNDEFDHDATLKNKTDDAMIKLQKSKMLMKRGDPNQREFASNFCNLNGLCKYIIEKPCKIAILCRLLVMMFIFQVMTAGVEALPVIILYQSFGVSMKWMVIWFCWWIAPIVLLCHFSFLTKRYISIMRHPWKYYYTEYDIQSKTSNKDLVDPLLASHDNESINKTDAGPAAATEEEEEEMRTRGVTNHLKVDDKEMFAKIDDTKSEHSVQSMGNNSEKSRSAYGISDKPGKYVNKGKEESKRKAWSIQTFKKHIVMNVILYVIVFWVTTIYAITLEHEYISDLDLTFLYCLVLTTYLFVALMTFSFLHVMFSKHDLSGLYGDSVVYEAKYSIASDISFDKNGLENGTITDDDDQILDQRGRTQSVPSSGIDDGSNNFDYGGDSLSNHESKSQNENDEVFKDGAYISMVEIKAKNLNMESKGVTPQPMTAKTLLTEKERMQRIKNSVDEKYGEDDCCYVCCLGMHWLMEKKERKYHAIYGKRVLYRRLFLITGIVTFGYAIIDDLSSILQTSVKQEFKDFLDDLDIGVSWPSDSDGGTIFDDAFELYEQARDYDVAFNCASLFFFVIAGVCDWFRRSKTGLRYSRIFGWFALSFLFVAVVSTAIPNYLTGTHLDDICPSCAPEFDNAVFLVAGDLIGILCSALFCVTMLPVLIAVTPSIARASMLVIHESHIFELNIYEEETLCYLFVLASFLTPLMSFLPLIVMQQLFGDNVTAIMLCIFWFVPILISFFFRKEGSIWYYFVWLTVYFGALLAIVIYELTLYGVPSYFISLITDATFYCEMFAEVCLANVVLSDFIYANLLTVDWDDMYSNVM